MKPSAKAHLDFLDTIRGLAVFAVFIIHAVGASYGQDQLAWGKWGRIFHCSKSFAALLPLTSVWEVPMFFVLSGFCIHLTFSRRPDWALFFTKRFFRIYPPYLVALLFFAFVYPPTALQFPSWPSVWQLGAHLAMVHNFSESTFLGINASFWSIALEVQLYVLYPVLLALVNRFGWRKTLGALAAIEITLRLAHGVWITRCEGAHAGWLANTPASFWFSWSLGAFVAERHLQGRKLIVSSDWLFVVGALALATKLFKPVSTLNFSCLCLLSACVIAKLLEGNARGWMMPEFFRRPIRRISAWSYSIYLLHFPLVFTVPLLAAKLAPNTYLHPLVLFAACIAIWFLLLPIAALYNRVIEQPSIALGRSFHAAMQRWREGRERMSDLTIEGSRAMASGVQ